MSHLLVSVHDVAPTTFDATKRAAAHLDVLGVRATYLLVPGPWRSPSLLEAPEPLTTWLHARAALGDSIALHGWTHRATTRMSMSSVGPRLVARGAAEFASLSEAEAFDRIGRGIAVLDRLGLPWHGFVPPGWLASRSAVSAAATLRVGYLATSRSIVDFDRRRSEPLIGLCQRPGSPFALLGRGVTTSIARRRAARGMSVRIALHPDDQLDPRLFEAGLAAIADCTNRGLRPSTYPEYLGMEVRA